MPKLRNLSGRAVCKILSANGFEQVRQRGSHVIMQKRKGRCARKLTAHLNTVMAEGIANNQVVFAKQMPDGTHIGRVSANVDNAVFGAEEIGDRPFQFLVNGALSRHHATSRNRSAVAINSSLRGFRDVFVP